MDRLNKGIADMSKQESRNIGRGYIKRALEDSTDYSKTIDAQQDKVSHKQRTVMLAHMDKTQGRDMLLYMQTEAYKNNLLENAKERILLRMERKKNRKKQRSLILE